MATGPVDNVILLADCYKTSHHKAYPPGTSSLYAYFESRGGRFPYTVFFGLQYILKRWLCGPVITKEMVLEAKEVLGTVFKRDDVFNEDGWNYILERHGGRIPVRIRAVPEGSVVPVKNVLFTVESTDPAVPWVTNFFETLLVQVWYPMTVATISRIHKQVIHYYMSLTHDSLETVEFSLHDAGYRGVSSVESAALGGAAHMINFKASDTVAGSSMLRKFYQLKGVAGFSTPSSEHSTVTTWGREGEAQAHRHMLEVYEEGTLVVCAIPMTSGSVSRTSGAMIFATLSFSVARRVAASTSDPTAVTQPRSSLGYKILKQIPFPRYSQANFLSVVIFLTLVVAPIDVVPCYIQISASKTDLFRPVLVLKRIG
ncbi:nicotinamide phosphoribosyltransferase-like [Penaeus monodon]|uniref:nicotinamide phosphoribosyltransferase-like n=1 Tax=Penaeus monodon TaxID=6687 RepID=UPI0018A7978B|nr:nicotinamide phosphoribosyltransferase-like [Penaeus monodon]